MAQQTAVEWFHEKTWELKMLLEKQQISVDEYGIAYYDILEESKEMEKKEKAKCWIAASKYGLKILNTDEEPNFKAAFEQYYTQTYKS
jgi:hypothetical protein